MSTLTSKQVGDEMSIYTFRPGTPTLKKDLIRSATKFYCFDKGHLRISGSIPTGFVAVPEQVILEFFGTKYTLNIRKLERAIEDYDKGIAQFRQGGTRPRRPTIRSLYLETPSDFELYLRPLDSFYCEKLKQNFSGVLNVVEKGGDWRSKVNNYATVTTAERTARWNNSTTNGQQKVIYVRLNNFAKMTPAPVKAIPPFIFPYPPAGNALPQPQPQPQAIIPDEEQKEAKDVDMLERTNMGRSRKYRKVLLHMSPWKGSIRVTNPFKSKAYRAAYMLAQHSFELRYADFKKDVNARRSKYRADWAAYKAFKDDQKSIKPSLPFVEKPDAVEFEKEWKEFIFGLKQEMKNIEFEPIRGAKATVVENQIRAERTVVPEISTVPALKPVVNNVVIEHVAPIATKPPMVLPELVIDKPIMSVVHEIIHTMDPDLLMIERDLQYSKRVVSTI